MVLDGRGTSANFWTAASPKSSRQMSLAGGKIKSLPIVKGFPHSSVGKESACNEEDPGSIPGLGRSPGEGIGYPLQYSWASLMAQLVKNLPEKKKKKDLPEMWETWLQSLIWEDHLEKGKATLSSTQISILIWRIPWTVHGVAKSRAPLSLSLS